MSRIVVMTNKIAATETKPVRIRAFFPEAPRYNHATISYDDSKSTYENHEDAFLALAETHKLLAGEWIGSAVGKGYIFLRVFQSTRTNRTGRRFEHEVFQVGDVK